MATKIVGTGRATVTYDYDAEYIDELTIQVGDVLEILVVEPDGQEGWVMAKLGGKEGLVADVYYELDEQTPPSQQSLSQPKQPDKTPPPVVEKISLEKDPLPFTTANSLYAEILFDYDKVLNDELTLRVGKIIHNVIQVDIGWYEGELDGVKGLFTDNFVKLHPNPVPNPTTNLRRRATVTYDYDAEYIDELTIQVGDVLEILVVEPDGQTGWVMAKLGDKIGVVADVFYVLDEQTPPSQQSPSQPKQPGKTPPPAVNEMVKNVAEDEEGWFEGQIGEKEGVFPGNFVKEEQKPALPPKAATGKRLLEKEKEIKDLHKEIDMKNTAIQEMKEAYQTELKSLSDTICVKNTTIQHKNEEIDDLTSKLKEYEKLHDSAWLEVSKTPMPWKIDRSTILKIPQKKIGVGAWGKVLSSHYQGEPVAIKYAHMALLEIHGTVDMIKREVSIMAHIQHPNLVRFIGAVLDDAVDSKKDVPIIVLELLDMNLRTAYTKEGLDKITMVSIFCDVAYGLHYLHEQSNPIIHRDVSAPNILLKRLPNQSFKAKISDFGSANLAKQSITAAAGAIIYTAPEMFPQEDITADPPEQTVKVDVFSYGIVLLEVVTKEMPAIEKRSLLLRSCKQEWEQIHDLVIRSTKRAPTDRPEMRDILNSLNRIPHV